MQRKVESVIKYYLESIRQDIFRMVCLHEMLKPCTIQLIIHSLLFALSSCVWCALSPSVESSEIRGMVNAQSLPETIQIGTGRNSEVHSRILGPMGVLSSVYFWALKPSRVIWLGFRAYLDRKIALYVRTFTALLDRRECEVGRKAKKVSRSRCEIYRPDQVSLFYAVCPLLGTLTHDIAQ